MKNTILGSIGEFLCPYSCISCGKVGGILCGCCKKYIISGNNWKCLSCGCALVDGICRHCALPFGQQFYLGARDNLLKELINIYKYKSVRSCAVVCADLFFENFGRFLENQVIVPLPTIGKHVRERGFDHTALLAKRLVWRCGGRVAKVLRRHNNAIQVGKTAEQRKNQAANAYEMNGDIDPRLDYALLDDVWTTGSSMLAACEVLQKAGAKNITVVLIAKSG